MQNAIPTRANLLKKGILCDPLCPFCLSKVESANHLFLDCIWARQVWLSSPLTLNLSNNTTSDVTDWLMYMFHHTDSDCMEKVITIIYSIWFARNQYIFRNITSDPVEISNKAMLLLDEYHRTCAIKPTQQHYRPPASETSNHNISWNPPTRGTLKINVDAHISDGRCFSGMILRRWDGSAVRVATRMHQHVGDALEGEAFGLNDALDMVDRYSASNVIFELDNQVIVRAVQRKQLIRKQWGNVVTRCINFLNRNPNSSIVWVNRNGNRVAHTLARWAEHDPWGDWPNDVPLCIKNQVLRDAPIL
ncbi:hypothetical protein QL285_043537 [Trifolium repens]|nr:hypothetical protein QL285_043537 [Trifolium repens]